MKHKQKMSIGKRLFLLVVACAVVMAGMADPRDKQVSSPDGRISVSQAGEGLIINYNGQKVIDIPQLGLGTQAKSVDLQFVRRISADYQMLAGKRLHCTNEGNEYEAQLDKNTLLRLRIYNDGVAFRYELKGCNDTLPQELTAYRIAEGTKRWMQQWTDAYEGFFPMTTSARVQPVRSFGRPTVSAEGYNCRWGYPMLVEGENATAYALITEANIERRQSASCLYNDQQLEMFRVVPDENRLKVTDEWHSPWRVVIVGSLADVVQSTLVTDVSESCRLTDTSWIHPGVVSWIYWAYNHGSNDLNIIKKYIDMAARLHLPYMLIDAEWDEMKDGKRIEDAIAYAKEQGVKPMIWYNSSVGWVDGAPGPKYKLNKPEDREREFAWCEQLGVAGVKIDFFSGDNQMNMDYCQDLLESAARHHLLVNFHGATIPRGWQRTYPNLLSTEGVYGAEWYNNVPTFTAVAASHNAMLPFTRNVIGPMDYTPCAFSDSQHPHITSNAHELALTVLFESGLQHLADKPESYFAQPEAVQQFLSQLPNVWDDTRFVCGYPGDYVVLARRSGQTWYVAGINGTDQPKTIALDWSFLTTGLGAMVFADSGNAKKPWSISNASSLPRKMECQPRGGFVMVVK